MNSVRHLPQPGSPNSSHDWLFMSAARNGQKSSCYTVLFCTFFERPAPRPTAKAPSGEGSEDFCLPLSGLFLRAPLARCRFLLGAASAKTFLSNLRGKGEVFALGLAYSCSQRPKKRELSPAATVPCLPTSTASCSRPLEPDTCIFPGEPISVSGIHASPRSVLAGICAGSKACNKGPERSCIEFVGPEKTRRRSNLG